MAHAPSRSLDNNAAARSAPQTIMSHHQQSAFHHDHILPGLPNEASIYASSATPRSRPLVARAKSEDEHGSHALATKTTSRLRTMTLESVSRNVASNTSQSAHRLRTTRGRMGSVHDFSCMTPADAVQPDFNSRSIHIPARPPDPLKTIPVALHRQQMADAISSGKRELSPASKARQDASIPTSFQMLQLMKSTRGKLEGHLLHRTMNARVWKTSYCCIAPESGSLLAETTADDVVKQNRVLVNDLRGCSFRASYDFDVRAPVIEVHSPEAAPLLKIRPKAKNMFNAWFAALLCWQPIQPGHRLRRVSRRPSLAPLGWLYDRDGGEFRPKSREEATVIKVGTLKAGTQLDVTIIETDETQRGLYTSAGQPTSEPASKRAASASMPAPVARWSNISCTLRENGEFTLYTKRDNTNLATVQLSQLSRCAVQRLHPSVMDVDCCIVIYPQFAKSINACSRLRPIFLSFDSKVLYEAWFVLLRAFTMPELYGPQRSKSTESIHSPELLPGLSSEVRPSLLRIERSISMKLSSARLKLPNQSQISTSAPRNLYPMARDTPKGPQYYVEILLDGQKKAQSAKVSGATDSADPVWVEFFDLEDLPSTVSAITVRLKEVEEQPPPKPSHTLRESASQEFGLTLNHQDLEEAIIATAGEIVRGEVLIDAMEAENAKALEKWWPIHNEHGEDIGAILLMLRIDQDNILMDKEYEPIVDMLLQLTNGMTIQMAEKLPDEPGRLAQLLLDVFQTCGKAHEWIMYLAEEEIDGILKERSEIRDRFGRRLDSNEHLDRPAAFENAQDRLYMVNESLQKATTEVSTLFRGNTLLTRSLDAHMRRIGRDYLDDTIGAELRAIAKREVQCEVDPTRVGYSPSNWSRLLEIIERISNLIFASAEKCPTEMRVIFRHIRSFAVDKYGDFRRSVAYTSVSSFLFLRFFIAAILHPKAFGLIQSISDQLRPRVLRTHTLVAKGLVALANLTTLGPKEAYMEPMNAFISTNRPRFKAFIDSICAVPSSVENMSISSISPSYSTPLQIFSRLPPASREGFLSLPHLLDRGRCMSRLVNHWLDHYSPRPRSDDPADRRERRSSGISQKWVEIAENMEENPHDYWVKRKVSSPALRQTARSQSADRRAEPMRQPPAIPSTASLTAPTPSANVNSAPIAIPNSVPRSHAHRANNQDAALSAPSLSQSSYSRPRVSSASSTGQAGSHVANGAVKRTPKTSFSTPMSTTHERRTFVEHDLDHRNQKVFDPDDHAASSPGELDSANNISNDTYYALIGQDISRTTSPLGLGAAARDIGSSGGGHSAEESTDGENGRQNRSNRKKDGWGLFGRRKNKEKEISDKAIGKPENTATRC